MRAEAAVLATLALGASPLAAAPAAATTEQSVVVVKMRQADDVRLSDDGFVSADPRVADGINRVLPAHATRSTHRLVPGNRRAMKAERRALPHPLPPGRGNLEDYYRITLAPEERADEVAADLRSLDGVATAYAQPLPAPPPENYVPEQTYLLAAPNGLGVNATIGGSATTGPYPGADGHNVKVADLEYSWNTQHEDVSKLRATGALWANGTPEDPFPDTSDETDHGTAAAGIVAADRNGRGIDGIVPKADFHTVNTYNENGVDRANAIAVATGRMSAGDVILIEQQEWASPGEEGYAPVEIRPDVYDAIRLATAKGITVIEPAGNGRLDRRQGYDLGDPRFGGKFTARARSGAILVGAGGAGCGATPGRARLAFSNYGSRVDLQGVGECVVTSGYGDLGGAGDTAYTATFGGTSSASAMTAGVAAELASTYEQVNGKALSPAALRAALIKGGSPQDTSVNPGRIGVLPNMAAVLRSTDKTPPSAPTLTARATAARRNTLTWTAAKDNLGAIADYRVYRNNVRVATVKGATTYADTAVKSKASYSYRVVAEDTQGNPSKSSNSVKVTTR